MHTGQNSIAPGNSLSQLGPVRLVSVLIVLDALQPEREPKATLGSTEWCELPAQRLANCCPIAQEIGCSFILARQIRFRNKIPATCVCSVPS